MNRELIEFFVRSF